MAKLFLFLALIYSIHSQDITCDSGVPCVVDCDAGDISPCSYDMIITATNATSLYVNCFTGWSEICGNIQIYCPDESNTNIINASCNLNCGYSYAQCQDFIMYSQGSSFVNVNCLTSACHGGIINAQHIYQKHKEKQISLNCGSYDGQESDDDSCNGLTISPISNDSSFYLKCSGGSTGSSNDPVCNVTIKGYNAKLIDIETFSASSSIELYATNASQINFISNGYYKYWSNIILTKFYIENSKYFNAIFNNTNCLDFMLFANNTQNINILFNHSNADGDDCQFNSHISDSSYYYIQNTLNVDINIIFSSHYTILFNATNANKILVNSTKYINEYELIATNASNININGSGSLYLPPLSSNISILCMNDECNSMTLHTQENSIMHYIDDFIMINCPYFNYWRIYCGVKYQYYCTLDFHGREIRGNSTCCGNLMDKIHQETINCSWSPTYSPTKQPTHKETEFVGIPIIPLIITISVIIVLLVIFIIWMVPKSNKKKNKMDNYSNFNKAIQPTNIKCHT